jgi:opacity protein-like surface antigen
VKKVSVVAFALLLSSGLAHAADMPMAPLPVKLWTWTGVYMGGHFGDGWGDAAITDPAGAAIYGNNVRSDAVFAGVQAGYNWQVPNTFFVLGVETDVSAIGANGSGTCLASSGFFISANCRTRPDLGGTLTGRAGYAIGLGGHTLIYAKGGLAWLDDRIDVTTNGLYPPLTTTFNGVRWGWTAGGGVERALTPAWSFKVEYDYARFGDLTIPTPQSFLQVIPGSPFGYLPTPGGTATMSQTLQTVKVGLNYKFGEGMYSQWAPSPADYHLRGATDVAVAPAAQFEFGGRVWYSSGRFQKDLGTFSDQSTSNLLVSRLTYNSTAASGELFGRVDTPINVFLKGFVGGGKLTSGTINDEDWNIFGSSVPYSNTSSSVKGDLAYATVDAGYSVFKGANANVGGFIGFNYYRENKQAYGCAQIANPFSDCVPSIPNSVLSLVEDDKWYSFRLGVNGVFTIWDRLKLTADAAWLPFVAFNGIDNHPLRTDVSNTVSTETGGGQGVQLEAILSYAFANGLNLGAGGRYWAMWAPGAYTNIFGTPCPCQSLPVRTERYGVFAQASYKFDVLQ